ncbi:MAG: hypothetical protein P4M11_11210 [Candidatus Pacebacteria bacterium]|nr:hypothetical protein [Candidatus Paceibacterota bacterium]
MNYYNESLDNEQSSYIDRLSMANYYPSLYGLLTQYETNEVCANIAERDSSISQSYCETDVNGTVESGLRQAIGVIMMHSYKTYQSFVSDPNRANSTVITQYLGESILNLMRNPVLIHSLVVGIKNVYLSPALEQTAVLFETAAMDFFQTNLSTQKILFICYIISALLIFFFVTQLLILGLNTDIWRAKRLLALYPAQKISENLDVFKQVLGTLS